MIDIVHRRSKKKNGSPRKTKLKQYDRSLFKIITILESNKNYLKF